MVLYDFCVIGAGMFGSAAARHASANVAIKVCLIGPEEPENPADREIFSSHYDEGRVTRILDPMYPCQILAKKAVSRYRELERLSGISFYHPVDMLVIGEKGTSFTEGLKQNMAINDLPVSNISHTDIYKNRFPYLHIEDNEVVLLDSGGAGHISPRNVVAAQQKVAMQQGCVIIRDIASTVRESKDSSGIPIVEVVTEAGKIIESRRVLVCTGAFTNFRSLVPNCQSLVPDIKVFKETVAMLEISKVDAKHLSAMPSILYDKKFLNNEEHRAGAYILPPIKYPNGKWYLKIGHGHEFLEELKNIKEVKAWYLSKGNSEMVKSYSELLCALIPSLKPKEITSATCVSCRTPSELPYIDRVTPILGVCVAGNGKGAKFSDEIGRIAAELVTTGKWDSELPQSLFQVQWADSS